MARERVSFRFEAEAHSVEGQLFNYLRHHKLINHREALIRALKAFYLPWVYEGEASEEEVRSLALSAIEDLEFRIFQIRKHFMLEDASTDGKSGSDTPTPNAERSPLSSITEERSTNGHTKGASATPTTPADPEPSTSPLSVQDVISPTVDPSVLDDFDNF